MSEHAWISGGCPFKGRRIDSRGNIKYKGEIIYQPYSTCAILQEVSCDHVQEI